MFASPNDSLTIVECPRDSWQGFLRSVPTETKISYLQLLTEVGFDTIDVGSFVSPKAVPQISDTHTVLQKIDLSRSRSKLLVIVANQKGALQACVHPNIRYLGYPFSISETFQQRNANSTISESLVRVQEIQEIASKADKELVIYLSMSFGNPYGDPWSVDIVYQWIETISRLGITKFSLADTVGAASPEAVSTVFQVLNTSYPQLMLGAHFHARPDQWKEKISAAFNEGCRRFDGTIAGFGGCPFAQDSLVGNVATENLLLFSEMKGMSPTLDRIAFAKAQTFFLEHIAPYR
jgi:hydroxymethylglutaryl-CoA lyase